MLSNKSADQLPFMITEERPTLKPVFMKFRNTGNNENLKRNETGYTQRSGIGMILNLSL